MTFPKRGGFAQDKRTGQYVRVTEEGGDGSWMVRTVYKTDGYWVMVGDLDPAEDPYPWTGRDLLKLAFALGLTGWGSWSACADLTGYGVPGLYAFVTVLPTGLLMLGLLLILFGLHRP